MNARRLTYLVAASIDGFIAGPDRGDPSRPDGFMTMTGDHMDGLFAEYPDTVPTSAREALGIDAPHTRFDTVVEGRVSYELGLAAGVTNAYRHLRHIVFSKTLTQSPDPTVEVVSTDPVAEVKRLKAEPGKGIWLVGGGTLAHALFDEIDELVVKLHPAAIGSGVPLFDGPFRPHRFRLTDHRVYDSGVVFLCYAKA